MKAQSILPIRRSLLESLERTLTPEKSGETTKSLWSERLQGAARKRGCRVFTDEEILDIRYRKEILKHKRKDIMLDYSATDGQMNSILYYKTRAHLVPKEII